MIILRIILLLLCYSVTYAQCVIYYKDAPLTLKNRDALSVLLEKVTNCPQSIQSFSRFLRDNNLEIKTSMVANRGKNNPSLGSFSFFSSISGILPEGLHINPGDFYFGHFTELDQDEIKLDQQSEKNKLLIELIAWDNDSQLFNFYELRGLDSSKTRWFYRGNSKDALSDNQYLYRDNPPNKDKFGKKMRCSACHNSGGPIMKELKAPNNDWWDAANELVFSPNHLDGEVSELVNTLIDADQFSKEVRAGIKKLNLSASYNDLKHALSLQEQLRPLFCTDEINLESNKVPGINNPITIPSGFWLNPILDQVDITIPAQAYQNLLVVNKMQFPETQLYDADHAWLTPVKGKSDILSIQQLIEKQIITRQFALSVLMIDYSHPVFSKSRCELLKQLPVSNDSNWVNTFINQLYKAQTKQPDALLLARYLSNSETYNETYFQKILVEYKTNIKLKLKSDKGLQDLFIQLLQARQDVFDNEISQNPLGEILEPGFRVIFPVPIAPSYRGLSAVSRENEMSGQGRRPTPFNL